MNSNHLPANLDLAQGMEALVLASVLGMEALEALVLVPEEALALVGAMEANGCILGLLEADLDHFHKSIHIRQSSHSSHSRSRQVHDRWRCNRCKR